jgi:hypothetical protein
MKQFMDGCRVRVQWELGTGEVVKYDPLSQTYLIRFDDKTEPSRWVSDYRLKRLEPWYDRSNVSER